MRQPIVQDGTSVKLQGQGQGLDVQGQGQGLQKVSSRPRPWPRGLHHCFYATALNANASRMSGRRKGGRPNADGGGVRGHADIRKTADNPGQNRSA